MTRAAISERYVAFLKAYASSSEAETLAEVQELGRELVTKGVPHEAIDQLHKEAVSEVAGVLPDLTMSEDVDATSPALIEVLMAYCLAFQEKTEVKNKPSMQELHKALGTQNTLMGWQDGSIAAQMAGVGPLRQRSPEEFAAMQSEYGSLLEAYLEAVGFGRTPPRRRINTLADRIGTLGGGPRDVIDVHLRSMAEQCKDVHPKREQAYAMEGRLLALELMGFLVDYYRNSPRSLASQTPTPQQKECIQ